MKKIHISKSSYILGLRCPRALFMKFNHPLSQDEASNDFLIEAGLEFEQSVRKLIAPYGIDVTKKVDHLDFTTYLTKTDKLLKRRYVNLYQATFQSKNGERVMTDIIRKKGKKIELIEVKAVSVLQDYHYYDISYQFFCLQEAGYKVDKALIATVNKDYVRGDNLSTDLVKMNDVTAKVKNIQKTIQPRLNYFRQLIASKENPDVTLGYHCLEPYPCPFRRSCWKEYLPEKNVFDIKNLRLKEKVNLYYAGYTSFSALHKSSIRLTEGQRIQIRCELSGEEIFERDKIKLWLQQFSKAKSLFFLDFETLGLATPQNYGDKPYQAIPIQYSVHTKDLKTQQLEHHEFLADPNDSRDQRLVLLESLLAILSKSNSPIIAFNKGFEAGRLSYLAGAFPQFKQLVKEVNSRLYDLADVFKEKWYYHPAFEGSYSIKYILPHLCPELSYKGLNVKNGSEASTAFLRLRENNCPKLRGNLLEYCKLDTLAMVKIMEALELKVKTTKSTLYATTKSGRN